MPHANPASRKIIFALDLDETSFVQYDRLHYIDPIHYLHLPDCFPNLVNEANQLETRTLCYIINPYALSRVIEKACEVCDEFVIFTSGTYDPNSTIRMLQNNLPLSTEAREKLGRARFHSSVTDCQYFYPELNLENLIKTCHTMKGPRIEELKRRFPELEGQWILFDDNKKQLESCENLSEVHCIHATTESPSKTCYQEAVDCLEKLQREREEAIKLMETTPTVQTPTVEPALEDLKRMIAGWNQQSMDTAQSNPPVQAEQNRGEEPDNNESQEVLFHVGKNPSRNTKPSAPSRMVLPSKCKNTKKQNESLAKRNRSSEEEPTNPGQRYKRSSVLSQYSILNTLKEKQAESPQSDAQPTLNL